VLLIVVTVTVISFSPVFGVVFATDTNLIVSFFVVNTTNQRFQKIFSEREAEQCNQPEAVDAAIYLPGHTCGPGYCKRSQGVKDG